MLAIVGELGSSLADVARSAIGWTAADNPIGTMDFSAARATNGRTGSAPAHPWKRDNRELSTPLKRLACNRELVCIHPTLLDRNGLGIEVSLSFTADFNFQYVGDRFQERTASKTADNSVLVIDLNADATRGARDDLIDQRSELVLSDWGPEGATDLQALVEAVDADGNLLFDTNADGALDANNTTYGEFRVWHDLDKDGDVYEGKLRTLAEAGIRQIKRTNENWLGLENKADDVSVGLAALRGTESFAIDGEIRVGEVGDLELVHTDQGCTRVKMEAGYRIEFETAEATEHRVQAEGETGFDRGGDVTCSRGLLSSAMAMWNLLAVRRLNWRTSYE